MDHSMQESPATRMVSFAPQIDSVALIESVADFSKKEKRRCWYSKKEMNTMRNRCIRDFERWESGNKSSCSRGLETMSDDGRAAMEAAIYACIDAVIDEQEKQWEDECDDFYRLALISHEKSQQCVHEAIERAIEDEKEARKIYKQEKQLFSLPTRPVRQVSNNDLELFLDTEDLLNEEDAAVLTKGLIRVSSKHVDLGTCSLAHKDICRPAWFEYATVRAKAA